MNHDNVSEVDLVLYQLQPPSVDELEILASKCDLRCQKLLVDPNNPEGFGTVILSDTNDVWNPLTNMAQNQALLSALISKEDGKLFYDDGIDEFFIYKYNHPGAALAHRPELAEAVVEAAMCVWCPESS